jgi:hypothetical protein
MKNYTNYALELEADDFYDTLEISTYDLYEEPYDRKQQEQEGLIYLFSQLLEFISPADFGDDEGLQGVLAS